MVMRTIPRPCCTLRFTTAPPCSHSADGPTLPQLSRAWKETGEGGGAGEGEADTQAASVSLHRPIRATASSPQLLLPPTSSPQQLRLWLPAECIDSSQQLLHLLHGGVGR